MVRSLARSRTAVRVDLEARITQVIKLMLFLDEKQALLITVRYDSLLAKRRSLLDAVVIIQVKILWKGQALVLWKYVMLEILKQSINKRDSVIWTRVSDPDPVIFPALDPDSVFKFLWIRIRSLKFMDPDPRGWIRIWSLSNRIRNQACGVIFYSRVFSNNS